MDKSTLRLTFPEAIAALKSKIPLPSTSWRQYSGEVQQVAFTVAKITQLSLLADIQALVIHQLETGVEVDTFKARFSELLDKSGFNLANRGYRSELVIQQNVRTSYSRGRWEQMRSPAIAKARPYWQWQWRDSRVPREHHLAQDGKVYPADADAWAAIFPPPFSCKCTAHALSDRDLERLGLSVSEPPPLKDIAEKGFDQGFSELPKERDRLVAEAIKRLPPEFADLLAESTTFTEAIEAALSETLNFATKAAVGKKPNCTAGKSHFCQTATGRGSCVPLSKKCKFKPTGAVKAAADWVEQKRSKAGTVETITPNQIEVDPKRFQYKIIGAETKTGEVGSLSGVKTFNPDLAGIIQVWQDPTDGKTYVVNGHNRLALANKLGADEVTVRYLNVKDAAEARAVGALTNIAEGRGDALDAAKFFRDTGLNKQDLDRKGIPIREKIATDGLALASLEPSLFNKTVQGDLTIERAAIIGGSGLDHTQQKALHDLVEKQSKSKAINNDVLKELADSVRESSTQSETQFDLFGASEVKVSNAIERATLQAAVKRRLTKDKKLFATVGKTKAAKDLSKAGNIIDVAQSQKISQEAASVLNLFNTLKNLKGPLSDALNEHATDLQSGGDRKKTEDALYKKIFEVLSKS